MKFLAPILLLFLPHFANALENCPENICSRIQNSSTDIDTSAVAATIEKINKLAACGNILVPDERVNIEVSPNSPYIDTFFSGRPSGDRRIVLSEMSYDDKAYPESPFILLSHEYGHALFDLNMSLLSHQWKVVETDNEDIFRHAYHELFADMTSIIYSGDPEGMFNALKDLNLKIIDPTGESDPKDLRRVYFDYRNFNKSWKPTDLKQWKIDLEEALRNSSSAVPYLIFAPVRSAFWSSFQNQIKDGKSRVCVLPKVFTILKEHVERNVTKMKSTDTDVVVELNTSLSQALKQQ